MLLLTVAATELERTQFALGLAILAVMILVGGWLSEDMVRASYIRRNAEQGYCPLHKADPTVCKPFHRDDE